MHFTPFRKSYGDFEIVIPAVDFSELTYEQAVHTTSALVQYKYPNWVCHHLDAYACFSAAECMHNAVPHSNGLDTLIRADLAGTIYEHKFWSPDSMPGQILRQEWVKHLINELRTNFDIQ